MDHKHSIIKVLHCIHHIFSVLEKVESLQEQLDAYSTGEKPITDTLEVPDGAVKSKRCKLINFNPLSPAPPLCFCSKVAYIANNMYPDQAAPFGAV